MSATLVAASFTVAPTAGLTVWLAVSLAISIGGVITAMKGRWPWLLAGLVLGGIVWPLTAALLPAEAGSFWARRMRRPTGGRPGGG